MKTNHIIGIGAASLLAVFFGAILLRQSSLESEIGILRLELSTRANVVPVQSGVHFSQAASENSATTRIGVPETVGTDEQLASARERISALEAALNAQADLVDTLMTEHNRVEEERRRAAMRPWGNEQATGAPDTMTSGDQRTAWAPASADGGIEWLEAEFQNTAELAKIVVRQTCNPGSVVKVAAIDSSGVEIPVWSGIDPSKGQSLADTPFAVGPGIRANRVKIYLDTSKTPGWEEIDAVQLIGNDGATQWAKSTKASSTYGASRSYRSGALSGDSFENSLGTRLIFSPTQSLP